MATPQGPHRAFIPGAFVLVVVCLLFTFLEFRYDGKQVGEVTGISLVMGDAPEAKAIPGMPGGSAKDRDVTGEQDRDLREQRGGGDAVAQARRFLEQQQAQTPVQELPEPVDATPPNVWAILTLLCAMGGIVLFFIGMRRELAVWIALGTVGAILLFLLQHDVRAMLAVQHALDETLRTGAFTVVPGIGFWGTLVGFCVAIAMAAMRMLTTRKGRSFGTGPVEPSKPIKEPPVPKVPEPVVRASSGREPPLVEAPTPSRQVPPGPSPRPGPTVPVPEPPSPPAKPPPPVVAHSAPSMRQQATPPSSPVPPENRSTNSPPPPPPPTPPITPRNMENQDRPHQVPPVPPSNAMNLFTGFARPFFNLIDSGTLYRKPFKIFYTVLAVLNLLSILGILGVMFKGGVGPIITGIFTIFALWVGFQLWWDRKEKVGSFVTPGSEFVALPVFSHLFQTIGEWSGAFVAIVGVGASLGSLLSGSSAPSFGYGSGPLGMVMGGMGIGGLIASPIIGFLILIVSRAIAEQIRALVAVANNTKAIERNTKR